MTVSAWLNRIDTELADNAADRDAHLADPTIDGMVAAGKLPAEALDWRKS